jgi:hypothetical protein
MVTLRRTKLVVKCVTWGNADPALERSWNVMTWAVAAAANGFVEFKDEECTPEQFAARLKLFPA